MVWNDHRAFSNLGWYGSRVGYLQYMVRFGGLGHVIEEGRVVCSTNVVTSFLPFFPRWRRFLPLPSEINGNVGNPFLYLPRSFLSGLEINEKISCPGVASISSSSNLRRTATVDINVTTLGLLDDRVRIAS
jgi:hypothetical protein